MTKHVGEPVRYMSGEHGTFVAEPGDELPAWVTGGPPDGNGPDATLADDDQAQAADTGVNQHGNS